MKTSELTGAQLDYWVAMAGDATNNQDSGAYVAFARMEKWGESWAQQQARPDTRFKPSTDWAQGGPIIERESITISDFDNGWRAGMVIWLPDHDDWYKGPTPLIAAMRAYVASKYGDSVPGA